jgi:hypothetical protein
MVLVEAPLFATRTWSVFFSLAISQQGRALRTETTINDTHDFGINKGLTNLPALWEVGFSANRRLLGVQRISHDPITGADAFTTINNPIDADGQHAAALRFGDPRAQALLATLLTFRLIRLRNSGQTVSGLNHAARCPFRYSL